MIELFQRMNQAIKNLEHAASNRDESLKNRMKYLKFKDTLSKEVQRINSLPEEGTLTLLRVESLVGTAPLEGNVVDFPSNIVKFPHNKKKKMANLRKKILKGEF